MGPSGAGKSTLMVSNFNMCTCRRRQRPRLPLSSISPLQLPAVIILIWIICCCFCCQHVSDVAAPFVLLQRVANGSEHEMRKATCTETSPACRCCLCWPCSLARCREDMLAMRKSLGNLTGQLLVNGHPATAAFVRHTSYVPQVSHAARSSARPGGVNLTPFM